MPVKKSTVAPKATVKADKKPARKSTNTFKRNIIDEELKNRVYVIKKGGGIWCKLRQNNITVYDKETKKVRQLRYSPNENSVFADEQGENIIREQVSFIKKNLIVPYTNPPLQKYLDLHPDNIANGGSVFYLVNEGKNAEDEVKKEFSVLESVSLVRDKSIDELLPVALYLGIDTNQKNVEIKRELLMEAKANPVKFIGMFDNPMVQTRSMIISAIDYQILTAASDGLKWFDSNRLIVSTPAGQDTVDVATRYCLSDKGALVFEEIKNQLEKI